LKGADLPHELEKVGQLFHWISENLYSIYSDIQIFQTFKRVYEEHFTVVSDKITVKSSDELNSSCIQSPDDIDAAYREKNGKQTKGQSINITETANPENPINLVNDVAVNPVNTDDSKALNGRIEKMKEKTPDLNELHIDGAYGSTDNDKLFEQHDIKAAQTAVKGRQATVSIDIDIIEGSDDQYCVSCPQQTVTSVPTRSRHKAEFDLTICKECAFCANCPTLVMKKCRTFYFTHDYYLAHKRQKVIDTIPTSRRYLRNNVEATVHEFTCRMPQKKLKVRGAFKTELFAFSVAAMVNFGRIYRYILENPGFLCHFLFLVLQLIKERAFYIRLPIIYLRLAPILAPNGKF
jgi:hypothetical protein